MIQSLKPITCMCHIHTHRVVVGDWKWYNFLAILATLYLFEIIVKIIMSNHVLYFIQDRSHGNIIQKS